MKTKTIFTFEISGKKLWSKWTGHKTNVDFILIAKLPDSKILYTGTIDSILSDQYTAADLKEIQSICLFKNADNKYLELRWRDNNDTTFIKENFTLLFVSLQEDVGKNYIPQTDSLLAFSLPVLYNEIRCHCFLSDKNQACLDFFWLSKEFL